MLVIVVGAAQVDRLQERERIVDAGLHVDAVLHHVDADRAFFLVRFLFLAFVSMAMAVVMHVRTGGYAVVVAVGAGGHAEVGLLAQPGRTDRAGARAHRAIGQRALGLGLLVRMILFAFVMVFEDGVAGNVVVVGVADQAVHMQHPVAVDAIQAEHAAALVVDRVAAHFHPAAERILGQLIGQAPVDHVDRAANGAAAEQQGRRSLQYFDLVGQERLDADRMIGTDGGSIHRTDAAGQHLHARAFLSADDRPADAGPEEGGLHARQPGDSVAQRRRLAAVQFLADQYVHRLGQGFGAALQRRSRHHDGIQIAGLPGRVRVGVGGQGGARGGENGKGQRTGEQVAAGEGAGWLHGGGDPG